MKIFVDTNIFLDVLLQREEASNSTVVLNAIKEGLYDGVVLDITLLNIDYVARKQSVNIKDFLRLIHQSFSVVGADNERIEEALGPEHGDFEDAVQYVCAKYAQCEWIVTNDKDFYQGAIKCVTAKEFIKISSI
jgi:predicted nucleic acid-binding protein